MSRKPNETTIKRILEQDRPDVVNLWADATRHYRQILGDEARDLNRRFANVDDMINYGTDRSSVWSWWRHDNSKMDRIRKLFMKSIDLIDIGTQKILAAATPAFPPASIISTALTFMLAGCKSVSADYDVVDGFFQEMNSFLQRIKILEGRLPRSKEYQTCLTDVFTSLLLMCAYAQKYIQQTRVKKWIANSILGQDGDLAGARSTVDKNLGILHSATELAILANTEESLEMNRVLRDAMNDELDQNSKRHSELLELQQKMLEQAQEQQQNNEENFKMILGILTQQQAQQGAATNNREDQRQKAKGIRSIILENFYNIAELKTYQENRQAQTCDWLFEEPTWQAWAKGSEAHSRPSLTLYGAPGIGKSYLAIAAYDHLQEVGSQVSGKKACVASFFCRKGLTALSSYQELINSTILQISDQNSHLHEQISAKLTKDDIIRPSEYFAKVLQPIYHKGSDYILYIIVDAVNELEAKEISALTEMLQTIESQELSIQLLITDREPMLTNTGTSILIDTSKVLPDLLKIIDARLNSTDSAYEGLRRLHIRVKSSIRKELEIRADGPLYVSVALRYLGTIGREGAIMRELQNLPGSAPDLLEKELSQCWRRIPRNLVSAIEILLAWLTFGYDTITLDGTNTLIRMYSSDRDFFIENEVDGVCGKMLRLSTVTEPTSFDDLSILAQTAPGATSLEQIEVFDDRGFMVALRHRALKDLLLRSATNEYKSWLSSSAAHRTMFLLCFRLISEWSSTTSGKASSTGQTDLHDYALKYCLKHWQNVDYDQHTADENIEVLQSLSTLLNDRHGFADQIEAKGYSYSIDALVLTYEHADGETWFQKFLDDWNRWSEWSKRSYGHFSSDNQANISAGTLEYWSCNKDQAMLPLVRAHVDNWLSTIEDHDAQTSYYFARKTTMMTDMRKYLLPGFPDREWRRQELIRGRIDYQSIDEIFDIRSISIEVKNTSQTALATALIIRASGFLHDKKFEKEIRIAKDSHDPIHRYLAAILEAEYAQQHGQDPKARKCIDSVLREDLDVPSSWRVKALNMLTEFEYSKQEVTDAFRKIRSLSPEFFVPGDVLLGEFRHYHYYGTPTQVLSFFSEISRIQQLTLLNTCWFGQESKAHQWLQDAAEEAGSIYELINLYRIIIGSLKETMSGVAWTKYLALLYRSFQHDDTAAKDVLVEALNIPYVSRATELFQLDTGSVAIQVINIMSDIIYEQFRNATDPTEKRKSLTEIQALTELPFPQTVRVSLTSKIPHNLVISNMVRKIDSPEEWQKELQLAFDLVWANLHDATNWNDGINLAHLSRILAQIPALMKDAQIVNSAQQSFRTETSAFYRFLKRNNQLQLYDSDAERLLEEWIRKQPQYRKYINDKSIKWDPKTNDFKDRSKRAKSGWNRPGPDKGRDYWFNKFVESRFGWKDAEIEGVSSSFTCAGCDEKIAFLQGQKMYTCLLCTDSALCETCLNLRISMNQDKKQYLHEKRFCCDGDKYLESPIPGWEGIHDGLIHIKGEEPMKWSTYLDGVKTRWDESWVEFWRN